MELINLKNLGFVFKLEDTENGKPLIRVTDRWHNQPSVETKVVDTLTIRLSPYTSYSEARAIANFLNERLTYSDMPQIDLAGAC